MDNASSKFIKGSIYITYSVRSLFFDFSRLYNLTMAAKNQKSHIICQTCLGRNNHFFSTILKNLCITVLMGLLFWLNVHGNASASPLAQTEPPTPAEIIEAVNALRISAGQSPLKVHDALMQAAQVEAEGIASGMMGHWRPENLTLGQWLLSLGYPLAGDLLQDGYRSENWIASDSAETAVLAWQGDELHTNTMLSEFRTDIGAGVAVGDEVIIVLITALQTRDGKMQATAYPILTQLASESEYGNLGTPPAQKLVPVTVCTARPDGDVIHKVQYGQSLWGLAIAYNTTIDQISAWNNLGLDTTIYEGQVLLVQKGATQPALETPVSAQTATIVSIPTLLQINASPTLTVQASTPATSGETDRSGSGMDLIIGLILAAIALGGLVTVLGAVIKK